MRFMLTEPQVGAAHPATPVVYVREPAVWEYRVLEAKIDRLPGEKTLNRYGQEGWELVSVFGAAPRAVYIFKRLA
jgi:uncharacterized protein DUF4177